MTPDEVFRFVNVRPVQQAPKDRVARRFTAYGSSDDKSALHRAIEGLPKDGARDAAVALAQLRLAAVDDIGPDRATVIEAVRAASVESSVAKASEVVKKQLKQDSDAFLKSDRGRKLKDVLWDRLYAHTLVPESDPEGREETLGGLRALHFLGYLGKQAPTDRPLSQTELQLVRPTIPAAVIPPSPSPTETWRESYLKGVEENLRRVHAEVVGITEAIRDLHNKERVYRENSDVPLRSPSSRSVRYRKSQTSRRKLCSKADRSST